MTQPDTSCDSMAIFRSLVVAGGGGRSTGGDRVWALSWFCSAWICCVRSATCSSSIAMMVGNGNKEGERFLKSSSAVRAHANGWCRQENNLIHNPPTEPSLEAQSIP